MFSCLCLTSRAEAKEPLPICSRTSYCSIFRASLHMDRNYRKQRKRRRRRNGKSSKEKVNISVKRALFQRGNLPSPCSYFIYFIHMFPVESFSQNRLLDFDPIHLLLHLLFLFELIFFSVSLTSNSFLFFFAALPSPIYLK